MVRLLSRGWPRVRATYLPACLPANLSSSGSGGTIGEGFVLFVYTVFFVSVTYIQLLAAYHLTTKLFPVSLLSEEAHSSRFMLRTLPLVVMMLEWFGSLFSSTFGAPRRVFPNSAAAAAVLLLHTAALCFPHFNVCVRVSRCSLGASMMRCIVPGPHRVLPCGEHPRELGLPGQARYPDVLRRPAPVPRLRAAQRCVRGSHNLQPFYPNPFILHVRENVKGPRLFATEVHTCAF